jgi:hypothetical protein
MCAGLKKAWYDIDISRVAFEDQNIILWNNVEDVQGSWVFGILALPPCVCSYHGFSGGVGYPCGVAFRALFFSNQDVRPIKRK